MAKTLVSFELAELYTYNPADLFNIFLSCAEEAEV